MRERRFANVAVLMGGPSKERDVSLASGSAVSEGLRQAGYDVLDIDVRARTVHIPEQIEAVFVALHGEYGEDGQIQAELDGRKIPYTGSGSIASEDAFDKARTKEILIREGMATPVYEVLHGHTSRTLPLPVVTKPLRQGSSIGVHRVFSEEEWLPAIEDTLSFGEGAMVEAYIKGRELTVGIVESEALPVIEVRAHDDWYDYKAKYTKGETEYLIPAPLAPAVSSACQELALASFSAFHCRGFGRVDFRMSEDGSLYVLELNSIPGFTETSLLPKAAGEAGVSFSVLCDRIMDSATYD